MISLGLVLLLAACTAAIPESPCTITVYSPENGPFALSLQQPITLQRLLYGPVNVLADVRSGPVSQGDNRRTPLAKVYFAFYLQNGLRSLKDHRSFSPLYNYLLNSDTLAGVAFYPGSFHSPSFFKNYVSDVVLEDNFSLHDYIACLTQPFPFLLIAPQYDFATSDFRGISDIGTFLIGNASRALGGGYEQNFGPQGFVPEYNQGIYQGPVQEYVGQRPIAFPGQGFPSQQIANRFGGSELPQNNANSYPILTIPLRPEDAPSNSSGNLQGSPSVKPPQSGPSFTDDRRGQDQRRTT